MDSKSDDDVNKSRRIHEKLNEQVDVIRELIHNNILTEQEYKDNKDNDKQLGAVIKQNIENKYAELDEYNDLGRQINKTGDLIGPGGNDQTEQEHGIDELKKRRDDVLKILKSKFKTKNYMHDVLTKFKTKNKSKFKTKNYLHEEKSDKPKELIEIQQMRHRDNELLRLFNSFIDQRGLFELPRTQITVIPQTIGDQNAPPSVSLNFDQEADILRMSMPEAFHDASPTQKKEMIAQYNQERESESRNSEQLGVVLAKLDALAKIVAKEERMEERFDEAKNDRREHADERNARFDNVDYSLKKISKQIKNYHEDMKRNVYACWPLTVWNVLPCMFKILGMVAKLLIVAHRILYQLLVATTSVVKATVGSVPYVGGIASFSLNTFITIGATMLYLALWTALFKSGNLDWDAQQIFIIVVTSVQQFIITIIEVFWDQIKDILSGMSGFVRQSVQPTLTAIGRLLTFIGNYICGITTHSLLRMLIGCETVAQAAANSMFSGFGGSKDGIKDDVKKLMKVLSNGTFAVPALFDLAMNIIGKAEKEARRNTSPYTKLVKEKLKEEGYGPGKKQINVNEISSKIMNELTDKVDYLVENIEGIILKLIPISFVEDEVSRVNDKGTYNIVISDKVPYDYNEENVLKGFTDMIMTWDSNFFSSWDKKTYLPIGFSVEDGEKLKKFVLKDNYVEKSIISQRTFSRRDVPYTDYTTMTSTMVPVASSSTQKKKKIKKRTKRHKKRSKRKRERRRRITKRKRERRRRIRRSKRR